MKALTRIFIILFVHVIITQVQLKEPASPGFWTPIISPIINLLCASGKYFDASTLSCQFLNPTAQPANPDSKNICQFTHSIGLCLPSKYRKFDGTCNNKNNRLWGSTFSISDRMLPAQYSDGVSAFQKSTAGNELRSARKISKTVFGEASSPDPLYTVANMQFGQFMAHDMSKGLSNSLKNGASCCSGPVGQYQSSPYPCFAINITSPDPSYPSNIKCMEFIRNSHTGEIGCPSSAPVNQVNEVTSFLDLSLIYGNNENQAKSLRTMSGGRLITVTRNGMEWPPQDPNPTQNCLVSSNTDICYLGGDTRLNQSPHLTIIHVVYIREHNRIAKKLALLNPSWSDETLYQEARRINIAQYQYVSYYEWLTIFLGKQNMLNNKILYYYSGDQYVNDYNATVKPTVFNEHANAAFRYFHSQIEGNLQMFDEQRNLKSTVSLAEWFNQPGFTESNFDDFTRGMVQQPMQNTDFNYDKQIRDFLLKEHNTFGMDLKALDIQRARDHGVARYNDFRQFCNLNRFNFWEDFMDIYNTDTLNKLRSVYDSINDVEFSVGSMLETHVPNTLVGPTLLCVLNKQFLTTRIADRYWFESGDPEVAFTNAQLAEIRKSSFARLICDNTNVQNIQPEAFKVVGYINNNFLVPCSQIPSVNLTKWKV